MQRSLLSNRERRKAKTWTNRKVSSVAPWIFLTSLSFFFLAGSFSSYFLLESLYPRAFLWGVGLILIGIGSAYAGKEIL